MINYGEEPSNQCQFSFEEGYDLMQEVQEWIKDNPDLWQHYLNIAKQESSYGKLSPNYVLYIVRHRYKVSIRNGYAPVLARLAMEQDSSIKFRIAKSKVDGFCDIVLEGK